MKHDEFIERPGYGASGPLRVLLVHNRYQQAGGEDAVVHDEMLMLQKNGVRVEIYERDNHEIATIAAPRLAAGTVWSRRTTSDIAGVIARFRPHVLHAHNTFPLISPSLYHAGAGSGVATVQTLHNFRLFCAQAMFMREGAICEDCIGKLPWRGILRRCYRDSAAQSAVLVGMLGVHRALGTFRRHVDCYIALNGFCRDKFVQAGLPVERIAVKPNFVDLPAPDFVAPRAGALYVGRLSPEKGIRVLAEAAASRRGDPIEVIGTGPAGDGLEQASGVALLGPRTQPEIYARMRGAAYLVLPSVWYENFPRVLVEAFACGLPVIASRLGAMAELIADRVTGLLFNPGDPRDLAAKMRWADAHPEILQRMGRAARDEYQHRYTPEVNFAQLAGIYEQAMRPNDFRSGAAKAPAPNKVIAETN